MSIFTYLARPGLKQRKLSTAPACVFGWRPRCNQPQKAPHRATPEQKLALEAAFAASSKPSVEQRKALAEELGLPNAKFVENWFATRRAKEKKTAAAGEGAASAEADASPAPAAAKEGQEKPAKKQKAAHTAMPADQASREQLGQQLAAEQAHLTEIFAAEPTCDLLKLLEAPLAEDDGLKRAVRGGWISRVSQRVEMPLFADQR